MTASPDALRVLLTRAERGVLSTTEATALRGHVEQLHADCQRWADCAAAAEKTRRAHAADADQYEAQLRARIAELEQQAAIDKEVMAKGDADWNDARDAVQKWRQHAEQWQRWGKEHRDRADRYRDRLTAAKARIAELERERDDLQHNLATRAYTAPDADWDTILTSLDARIRDAVDRADRAEAAVDRAEAAVDRVRTATDTPPPPGAPTSGEWAGGWDGAMETIRIALDGPAQPAPQS